MKNDAPLERPHETKPGQRGRLKRAGFACRRQLKKDGLSWQLKIRIQKQTRLPQGSAEDDTGGRSGPHWVPLLTAPGSLGHMGKLCKIQKGNRIISMHTLSCSSSNAPPDITAERPVPPNAGPRQQARKMCRGTRLTPVPRPTRHGEVRPHDAWMTPRSLLLGLRTAAGLRAHRPLSRALPKATDKLVLGV